MATGLTPQGLLVPTLQDIKSEIEAAQLAAPSIGPNVDQSETSALGQINGIVANQIRLAWEAIAGVYNGLNPDANGGTVQDSIAAITGTTRRAATHARTVHSVTLATNTYAIGTLIIRPVGTTQRYSNAEEIIAIPPGGVVSGVIFDAEVSGLTSVTTSTVFEIAAPLVGFTVVSVPSAVTNGKNIESDEELRVRREIEVQGGAGSTTVDAIRSAILSADIGVEQVSVYENVTDTIDSRGVAPFSVEAVVQGPTAPTSLDDLALAETIFRAKAGGVRASGTQEELIVDSQGNDHNIGFSRPVAVPVKSSWVLKTVPGIYNESAVKTAIAAFAPLDPGQELQWTEFICVGRAAGVTDVVTMTMAKVPDGLGTQNIQATVREYLTMNVANITIVVV